jgi:hypothetical protein
LPSLQDISCKPYLFSSSLSTAPQHDSSPTPKSHPIELKARTIWAFLYVPHDEYIFNRPKYLKFTQNYVILPKLEHCIKGLCCVFELGKKIQNTVRIIGPSPLIYSN